MNINDWLPSVKATTVPLFDSDGLRPRVFERGGMRKLKRHPDFDAAVVELVEMGLAEAAWIGAVYLMHFGAPPNAIEPLYIGKFERKGKSQSISFNVANIRANDHAFARWGYGLAYHIGDLSHAIFREPAYKRPGRKYERWASCLFASFDPLTLRQLPYVTLVSWHDGMCGPSGLEGGVPAVEKELIALCGGTTTALLNIDGR